MIQQHVWGFPFTEEKLSSEACAQLILSSGQVEIRDVAAGELPFEYSASTPKRPFFGPGYLLVKSLVAQDQIFLPLVNQLALRVAEVNSPFEVICGNVSGGMIPAYVLKLYLQRLTGCSPVVYIYARGSRKDFGSQELLVGFGNNRHIKPGMKALDVEELVNRANTTCNAVRTLRNSGLVCNYAATLLDYWNPQAVEERAKISLTQISLTTLPILLDMAIESDEFSVRAVKDYRRFLENPNQWQEDNKEVIQRVLQQKQNEE